MKKRIPALALAVLLIAALCACAKNYSFGTGNIGGNYYAYGNALSSFLQEDDVTVTVKTTAGSAANLRLLQKGFLDMAIVQSDMLQDAVQGDGFFEGSPCEGVRAVAGLYMEECQIIVRADSDITSVDDLYGRAVSVGEQESGVLQNAQQILAVSGMSLGSIQPQYLSFSDSAAALRAGEIEAFFCTAGAPTTAVQELARETDIRVLSLDAHIRYQLTREYPCYTECIIPAGTYAGQTENVYTIGVKAVLVVSNKLPENFVLSLTDTLFGHASELQYATGASELTAEFATDAISVPFHLGAADWYESCGITVPTGDEGSTTFGITVSQD